MTPQFPVYLNLIGQSGTAFGIYFDDFIRFFRMDQNGGVIACANHPPRLGHEDDLDRFVRIYTADIQLRQQLAFHPFHIRKHSQHSLPDITGRRKPDIP
jgi:hypothetical protein